MITTAEWESFTPEQKRVALAKDVLQLLEAGKIKPPTGASLYCGVSWLDRENSTDYADRIAPWQNNTAEGSGKEMLHTEGLTCEVCLKGALVVAYVHNFNTIPARQLASGGGIGIDNNPIMVEIFGEPDWRAIEGLYEKLTYPKEIGASAWYSLDKIERMRQVMTYVIETEGRTNAVTEWIYVPRVS